MILSEALARIDSFADFAEGWNSYGAKPIAASAREAAKAFLQSPLACADLGIHWHPMPLPDGGVQLDWSDVVEVEFSPSGRVSLCVERLPDAALVRRAIIALLGASQ